jgi:hypothetical protein
MVSSSTELLRPEEKRDPARGPLDLPEPRIWEPKDLAQFLAVSVHWVYKRTERNAKDPIPRIPGVGRLRFDTYSVPFQQWLLRHLGYVDTFQDD